MADIKVDFNYAGIEQTEMQKYEKDVIRIHEGFYLKEKIDTEFLGWLSLPTNYNREEFSRIKKAANKIGSIYKDEIVTRLEKATEKVDGTY